ncbi:MAG: hypothetical protein ACRD0U_00680 [Acidimicrobiales bacterium]
MIIEHDARQPHPGPHTIDIQANGRVLGSVTVEVCDQDPSADGG